MNDDDTNHNSVRDLTKIERCKMYETGWDGICLDWIGLIGSEQLLGRYTGNKMPPFDIGRGMGDRRNLFAGHVGADCQTE